MWFLLLACTPSAGGRVSSEAGPVAGAVVRAVSGPALDAVTDGSGQFRVKVQAGQRRLRVTHPDFLPAEVDVEVEGHGLVELPPIVIVPIPDAPGIHLLVGDHFEALRTGSMERRGTREAGFRWCVDRGRGGALSVPVGPLRLLDNHEADWRLLRLDADGCAYQLVPTPGGYFDQKLDRVEVHRVEAYAPGRDWLEVQLDRGDYVFAEWFAGGFVPEVGGWRGSWVKAE